MVNEKRFIVESVSIIDDCNEDKSRIAKVITDTDETYSYEDLYEVVDLLNEQQATINELQSIINHIKCEENCEDYDYCCETVCSLYNEIKHLKEENEQLKK